MRAPPTNNWVNKRPVSVKPKSFRGLIGFKIDDSLRQVQCLRLEALRNRRDPAMVDQVLQSLNDKASSGENIMPAVIEAVDTPEDYERLVREWNRDIY